MADGEIFLKPIELEEIGKFERPDIVAGLPDFLLQLRMPKTHRLKNLPQLETVL